MSTAADLQAPDWRAQGETLSALDAEAAAYLATVPAAPGTARLRAHVEELEALLSRASVIARHLDAMAATGAD